MGKAYIYRIEKLPDDTGQKVVREGSNLKNLHKSLTGVPFSYSNLITKFLEHGDKWEQSGWRFIRREAFPEGLEMYGPIRMFINELPVSKTEIAEKVGIGIPCLSRFLSGKSGLHLKNFAKLKEICKEYGYTG